MAGVSIYNNSSEGDRAYNEQHGYGGTTPVDSSKVAVSNAEAKYAPREVEVEEDNTIVNTVTEVPPITSELSAAKKIEEEYDMADTGVDTIEEKVEEEVSLTPAHDAAIKSVEQMQVMFEPGQEPVEHLPNTLDPLNQAILENQLADNKMKYSKLETLKDKLKLDREETAMVKEKELAEEEPTEEEIEDNTKIEVEEELGLIEEGGQTAEIDKVEAPKADTPEAIAVQESVKKYEALGATSTDTPTTSKGYAVDSKTGEEYFSGVKDSEMRKKYTDMTEAFEGNVTDLTKAPMSSIVPSSGSGVTLSTGLDLSQMTKEEVKAYGVSDANITKLVNAGAFGKTGAKARVSARKLKEDKFKLSSAEQTAIEKSMYEAGKENIRNYATKYPNLSTDALLVLAQANHWAGSPTEVLTSPNEKFSIIDNEGNRVNKLKELFDSKGINLTNDELKDVVKKYSKYWQGRGWTSNRNTFARYYQQLGVGNPNIGGKVKNNRSYKGAVKGEKKDPFSGKSLSRAAYYEIMDDHYKRKGSKPRGWATKYKKYRNNKELYKASKYGIDPKIPKKKK